MDVALFRSLLPQAFPENLNELTGLVKLLDRQIENDDRPPKSVFRGKVRLRFAPAQICQLAAQEGIGDGAVSQLRYLRCFLAPLLA